MLSVSATLDAAGDGWIQLWLKRSTLPFIGFYARSVYACDRQESACDDVPVFGGTSGLAEASRMHVSAGYAFVHGVIGACLSTNCNPVITSPFPAAPTLLTTLSVAMPRIDRSSSDLDSHVCVKSVWLHPVSGGAAVSASDGPLCAPLVIAPGLGPSGLPNGSEGRFHTARGVAMVKTYKTGSSTLGALLHRYADSRGLDVAVNAKALKTERRLRRHLHPGTMPNPTECLFEFHTFRPCGRHWTDAQAKATGGHLVPKPLQLVVDHSRWQPLDEILNHRAYSLLPDCDAFVERMRAAADSAHLLFLGGDAPRDLRRCILALASRQATVATPGAAASVSVESKGAALKAPLSYRETIPSGLLVTIMRWPAARFISALEQFSIPQKTVPCVRSRHAKRRGTCYGHTCEADFRFSWRCMNQSVDRPGMLATVIRCLIDRSDSAQRVAHRLADLDAIAAKPAPSKEAADALGAMRARLQAEMHADGTNGGRIQAKFSGCEPERRQTTPSMFRFVKEAVANTLGWPFRPTLRGDSYRRMLATERRKNGRGPRLPLEWLASLARSLDFVLISEHFDESLLLLSRLLRVPSHDLIYMSQKRRTSSAAESQREKSPAGRAALNCKSLENVTAWPGVDAFKESGGPSLWPSELDAALRANWLDSLAYMFYNTTLWMRIEREWPGPAGRAAFQAELSSFRATRAMAVAGCLLCQKIGDQECLNLARAVPGRASPHFCWSLRQDTRSWSEHFFKRMALRFDAAASAHLTVDNVTAGVKTGNVNWWRCKTRTMASRCTQLERASAQYGLWECACHW